MARLLAELTNELQQRKSDANGIESRTELHRAIQEAVRALEGLLPRQTRQAKRRTRDDVAPPLHEPKRKAIRAALLAGVAPGQVAKHFGLPLAAVRKVLTQAEQVVREPAASEITPGMHSLDRQQDKTGLMPRSLKAKALSHISPAREFSTYQLHIEDEAGKKALFELTSKQAVLLADVLDNLLADEEVELGLTPPSLQPSLVAREGLGVVKQYNTSKDLAFVILNAGGEELFLHRSTLEQAGMSGTAEGTRDRIQATEGKKGPQVSTIVLA